MAAWEIYGHIWRTIRKLILENYNLMMTDIGCLCIGLRKRALSNKNSVTCTAELLATFMRRVCSVSRTLLCNAVRYNPLFRGKSKGCLPVKCEVRMHLTHGYPSFSLNCNLTPKLATTLTSSYVCLL